MFNACCVQISMKMARSIVVAAALTALAAALLAVWFLRAPRVPAVALAQAPLVRTLQFSARVATASRVDLGSTITGRVLRVEVVEGERVRQGQVLVRLESDELKAALAQALASERQVAARLGGLRSTGRSSAQAALAQTDSVLVAAQAELQRTQDLVTKGFLSPARLDEAQRAVAVARAQQAGALAQRAANDEQGTDVAQAQAQLALAAAATAAARARLEQAALTAPADAQVLARAVEPGQIVQPGRALLTLALAGSPQLSAQVDERFLQELQVGQRARVMADAFPGQRFEARVAAIAPLVDAQRGAIEVKFSLSPTLQQSPPPFLREDMTLSVEVETARRENALVLPTNALRSEGGAAPGSAAIATVWIERNGRVEARPVRLGLRTLDAAEVLDGLAAGDAVLVGDAPPPGRRVHANVSAATALAAKRANQDAGSAMTNAMGR
jgi:HlyD family secretion protein